MDAAEISDFSLWQKKEMEKKENKNKPKTSKPTTQIWSNKQMEGWEVGIPAGESPNAIRNRYING